MITSAFILLALYIVTTILNIFPTSTGLPASVDTAVSTIGGYVGMFDPIFPTGTMATIIGLIIVFELAIFAFKGFKWIFSYLPFIGGK